MKQYITTPDLHNIKITDEFFSHYVNMVATKLVPYQWEILNDRIEGVAKSYVVSNFKRAAGLEEGKHQGAIFCDTDAYKWLETVAFCLAGGKAKEYEKVADDLIELIGKAQEEDGYLDTYFILSHPEDKWTNLVEGHELYGAGHLIEAAVAYYKATNKDNFLNIAIKLANLVYKKFIIEKKEGVPGHEEIELALIKLYQVTKNEKYIELAKHFIDKRGEKPNYLMNELVKNKAKRIFPEFADYDDLYAQSQEKPVNQMTAEGHAVRAMYLYSAMADLARETKDSNLKQACKRLWNNVTLKRMYITGGIGSSGHLERFTADYDLPNDRMYCESCASVGLMMFGQRMNNLTGDAKYYEIVEKALCNTVLAGISTNGDKYFYVNPLEVWPDNCLPSTSMQHVKPVRQPWFSCACCPPNIARTLASIGQYIYAQDEKSIYINQFISSNLKTEVAGGKIELKLEANVFNDTKVECKIKTTDVSALTVRIRIPYYFEVKEFELDGRTISPAIENGYAVIAISKAGEQTLSLKGEVRPKWIASNENVRANTGKLALMYGPYVYCMEEEDNGKNLQNIYTSYDNSVTIGEALDELPGKLPTLKFTGERLQSGVGGLYAEPDFKLLKQDAKAIPYCLWCNRRPGEMLVWMNSLIRSI